MERYRLWYPTPKVFGVWDTLKDCAVLNGYGKEFLTLDKDNAETLMRILNEAETFIASDYVWNLPAD